MVEGEADSTRTLTWRHIYTSLDHQHLPLDCPHLQLCTQSEDTIEAGQWEIAGRNEVQDRGDANL